MPTVKHMDPTKKKAIERNLQSQHEPHACSTGCCEHHHLPPSHHKHLAFLNQRRRQESYNGPRSWVIEHGI
ncbi:hypothetical protein [Puniceicoccus vermicola]|uniref:Uncharacterized protein n=1 Tax=Puniceicoccus vermicola TaxID=388746 RepID=A0A7X1B2C7_9BACT|nr:hypothetical protein [Puniceicoccus vermicola]MBC2604360.1 hypothetical protein [Puniceicoccus vermicola]